MQATSLLKPKMTSEKECHLSFFSGFQQVPPHVQDDLPAG